MTEKEPIRDVARELEYEHIRARSSAFIGSILGHENVSVEFVPTSNTLLDHLEPAAHGDVASILTIGANVHTELIEWTQKSKNIVSSRAHIDADMHIYQHGQSWRDVQANTLLYRDSESVVGKRSPLEVANHFAIESYVLDGTLQNYWFIASSLVPTDLTPDDADKEGFFGETMSAALQATTQDSHGLLTESAFVAAADSRGGERFDKSAMQKVYEHFGIDISGLSSEEILARPLLIHKDLLPNGVADFVKLYDTFAGGNRFFGVKGAYGEYEGFADRCVKNEKQLEDTAATITDRLIAERHYFTRPMDVVARISYLAKHYLVERAKLDTTIDPIIFGHEAAERLALARELTSLGYTEQAAEVMKEAHKSAKGSACGSYSGSEPTAPDGDWSGGTKKKFSKCKSCKVYAFEVGGCDICESCTKKPWKMEHAWQKHLNEEREAKKLKAKANQEQFTTAA